MFVYTTLDAVYVIRNAVGLGLRNTIYSFVHYVIHI